MEGKEEGTSPGVLGSAGSHCRWPRGKFSGVCRMSATLAYWREHEEQGNCMYYILLLQLDGPKHCVGESQGGTRTASEYRMALSSRRADVKTGKKPVFPETPLPP